MKARTSWGAMRDDRSPEDADRKGSESAIPLADLLDARFDEQGRLAQIGRGQRQRIAERLDPRPPAISADDLEQAVQKLARGLESLERHGVAPPPARPAPSPPQQHDTHGEPRSRDFVTHSLDRLEARLEALSKRLEQRAGAASPAATGSLAAPPTVADQRPAPTAPQIVFDTDVLTEDWPAPPSFAVEPRRQADDTAEVERRRIEAREAELRAAAAEAERHRIEAMDAERRAAAADAERRRIEATEAELRAAAADAERRAREAEAARRAEATRQAEAAADMQRQFAALVSRLAMLQQNGDNEHVAELRHELHDILGLIEELGRDGRSVAAAVEQIRARLDAMEPKVNAARNMAGNRLGELQDRLSDLGERLQDMEAEIPGFDAVRENQTAILERFDRIEGMVHRLASPEELWERLEGLRGQLRSLASQPEVERIGQQILTIADRLEALPDSLGDRGMLERLDTQLQALGTEFMEARRRADGGAADLDRRLAELSAALNAVGESSDLSRLEVRFSDIAARLDQDRRTAGETLARLEKRLSAVAAAVETQEGEAAADLLSGITQKIEALAGAIDAQDAPGTRRDVEALSQKLDQLATSVAAQAEHFSQQQVETLEARLDRMQSQLEAIARAQASGSSFGPFAQKLQDIAERISSLDVNGSVDTSPITVRLTAIENHLASMKAVDPRALHNQLDSIMSRLEVLKGRSIDPARLNELLDRAEAVMNLGFADERFDRLEQKLEGGAQGGLAEERFARLEKKLDDFGAAIGVGPEVLTQEDLTDLRGDIVALRRELRSLPGLGEGEASLSKVLTTIASRLERLPDDPPASATELEAQIDRIAQLLEDPTHSRLALAHIEASLQAISERLDDTRRSMSYRSADDLAGAEGVADLARALSDDVSGLKDFAQASERKTKDALEAVQGTLEAVVKRMAFLERDADQAARPVAPGAPAHEPGIEAVPAVSPAAAEPPRETGSASLFSRLTSTQLLRRATGGRAESFSPDVDNDDLPLEPGTNEPLSSALAGAPSSDTALMSGERTRSRAGPSARGLDTEPERARRAASDAGLGDDFLAAARRAAQAAAAEVAQADRAAQEADQTSAIGRLVGLFKGRRRVVLASALGVAIAFAAVQIIRGIVDSDNIEVAAVRAAQTTPGAAPSPVTREITGQAAVGNAIGTESVPTQPSGQPSGFANLGSETPAADSAPTESAGAPLPSVVPEPPADREATGSAVTVPTVSRDVITEAATAPALPPLPAAIGPDRLRSAAAAGDAVAAFEVAARYAEGRGVGQDLGAAIEWYEFAGQAGLAPAQYRLGSIYEKGLGVTKDLAMAQEWYRRAAEAGNVKAMHNLAVLYAEGAGGKPDLEKAAALFRKAAEHGVRDSQFNLAILHARGLGVPQDMLEAYKWFAVAASSGDAESVKRRDIVAAALSQADLAKGQAAAEAFQPLPLIPEANDVAMPEGGWGQETTSVQLQDQNEMVALIQSLLAQRGFDPGPADGLLGSQTIRAISAFQEEAGLPQTGVIDASLVSALTGGST